MLLKVKLLIVKPVYFLIKQFYFNQFKRVLNQQTSYNSLHIFDLDNTLAHTYPNLHQSNTAKMYEDLPTHKRLVDLANKTLADNKSFFVVLSARDYKYKTATKAWLNKHLDKKDVPLFLVPKAKDKLPYLDKAVSSFETVTYYDDLSYNQENDNIQFYDSVIRAVNKMPLTYFGYEDISKLYEV